MRYSVSHSIISAIRTQRRRCRKARNYWGQTTKVDLLTQWTVTNELLWIIYNSSVRWKMPSHCASQFLMHLNFHYPMEGKNSHLNVFLISITTLFARRMSIITYTPLTGSLLDDRIILHNHSSLPLTLYICFQLNSAWLSGSPKAPVNTSLSQPILVQHRKSITATFLTK